MDDSSSNIGTDLRHLAADLVAAYVSNNPLPAEELPALLRRVHEALIGLRTEALLSKRRLKRLPCPSAARSSPTGSHAWNAGAR